MLRTPVTTLDDLLRDRAQFEDWYGRAMPRVYAYLFARCGGDGALAEDLTQATFVEAVRSAHRWEGRSDLITWLIAIARHKLIDELRRTQRDDRRHAALAAAAPPERDPTALAELDLRIADTLAALPPDQRIALVLRTADGLSTREIADVLGRSEDAAESLLRRARAAFRAHYEGDDRA